MNETRPSTSQGIHDQEKNDVELSTLESTWKKKCCVPNVIFIIYVAFGMFIAISKYYYKNGPKVNIDYYLM